MSEFIARQIAIAQYSAQQARTDYLIAVHRHSREAPVRVLEKMMTTPYPDHAETAVVEGFDNFASVQTR